MLRLLLLLFVVEWVPLFAQDSTVDPSNLSLGPEVSSPCSTDSMISVTLDSSCNISRVCDAGENNCDCSPSEHDCSNHSLVVLKIQTTEKGDADSLGKNECSILAVADWVIGRVRLSSMPFLIHVCSNYSFVPGIESRQFFSEPIGDSQEILKAFAYKGTLHALYRDFDGLLGLCWYNVASDENRLKISLGSCNATIFTDKCVVNSSCIHVEQMEEKTTLQFGECITSIPKDLSENCNCSVENQSCVNGSKVQFPLSKVNKRIVPYENSRARWMNDQVIRMMPHESREVRNGWIALVLPMVSSAVFLLVGLALMNKYYYIHLR